MVVKESVTAGGVEVTRDKSDTIDYRIDGNRLTDLTACRHLQA